MGRKLSNVSDPTPVVSIKSTPGTFFEGVLTSTGREVPLKKGKATVFEFVLNNTDMGITLKGSDGKYQETSVEAGAKVSVFAPTVLKRALEKAQVGETILIKYLGKEQGKNGGAEYHNFDVEAL